MKSVRKGDAIAYVSLLLIVTATIFTPGCRTPSSQGAEEDGAGQYFLKPGKVDNFYVLSSDLDDRKRPRYITYVFAGQLRNNTEHVYADVTIKMKVSLVLENGNALEEKDLNDIPFNDMLSHKFFHNWKPGETVNINKVVSISIPVEYADYPVKDVVLDYSLNLEDKVGQTNEEMTVASVSVIDKWKAAVKRVKYGKTDTDDNNFPDKILNGISRVSQPEEQNKKVLIDE